MFPKIRNRNIVKQSVLLITDFIEQFQLPKGFRLYLLIQGFKIWFILTNERPEFYAAGLIDLVFFSNFNNHTESQYIVLIHKLYALNAFICSLVRAL